MPKRLTNLSVVETTICKEPANQHARIVLFKSRDGLEFSRTLDVPGQIDFLVEKFLASPDLPATADITTIVKSIKAEKETAATALTVARSADAYSKREFSADERKKLSDSGAAMPDGGFPIQTAEDLHNAMRAIGRAKDPAKAKAHIRARAKALGLSDELSDAFKSANMIERAFVDAGLVEKDDGDEGSRTFDEVYGCIEAGEFAESMMEEFTEAYRALNTSVFEIVNDGTLTDKTSALATTFQQFKDHIQDVVPEAMEDTLEKTLAAGITAALKKARGHNLSISEDEMNAELLKALGLTAGNTTLQEAIGKAVRTALGLKDDASDDDVVKAIPEVALGLAIAKMSDKHSAFMANAKAKMPSGGKKAFASMSASDRDAHMKANPVADDEEADSADKMAKELATMPQWVKDEIAKGKTRDEEVSKLRDASDRAEIAKSVDSGMTLVGKAADLVDLIHDIRKADPALADRVSVTLTEANKLVKEGGLFTERGNGSQGFQGKDTTAAINKLAEEKVAAVAKSGGAPLTIEKARGLVRKERPDLREQEEKESAARKSKAA